MEPSSTINNNVSEPQPITSFAQNGNEIANFPPSFISNSPGDTENDNDNYREEEAQHEFEENQAHTGITLKKRFCEDCNMFYYGRVLSNDRNLKVCPNCNSAKVSVVRDENIEQFSYTHFGNENFQYTQANGLPQAFEGYFINPT